MEPQAKRTCLDCNVEKSLEDFRCLDWVTGKTLYQCKSCENIQSNDIETASEPESEDWVCSSPTLPTTPSRILHLPTSAAILFISFPVLVTLRIPHFLYAQLLQRYTEKITLSKQQAYTSHKEKPLSLSSFSTLRL